MRGWREVRGPLALCAVYALAIGLWLDATGAGTATGDASALIAAGALGAGIAGFAGFAANIVLGGRLPAVDRFFGGLEAMYRAHRLNGRLAYLLVLVHVVLVLGSRAIDSVPAALRLLSPSAGAPVLLGVLAFIAMTASIVATLYARLTHETFVYVQRTFGLVFALAGVHAFTTAGAKAGSRALTVYLGFLSAAAVGAFVYRSLFGNILVRRYDYVVSRVRFLDDTVIEIAMSPVDRWLNARPGQFVFVTFYSDSFNAQFHPVSVGSEGESAVIVLRPGDARDQFHPFSLTSPGGSRELTLAVKAVGDFTSALRRLEPGAAARVEGPYGTFSHLDIPNRRQVWIAGGIGITPFLSMARSLEGDAFDVDLYWGVNTRPQAYFAEEIEEVAAALATFRFHLVVEESEGFITPEMVADRSGFEAADILIVGPPSMERALREQFRNAGVADSRIHSERFAFGPRR